MAQAAAVKKDREAAQAAAPAEDQKKREPGMAVPNRVQMAEHGRNIHLYTAPAGAAPEDMLAPAYWGLVSKNFAPYDHVEVRTDDGRFWAEYIVIASDRTWAKLHPLRVVELPNAQLEEVDPGYKIEWKGPHLKFCVLRVSDGSSVHEGEQERSGAVSWLQQYLRTIGTSATKPK